MGDAPPPGRGGAAAAVAAAAGGMVLFGLFAHRGLPWTVVGAGGLLLAAAAIVGTGPGAEPPAALLGCGRPSRRALLLAAAGVVLGAGAGLLHRRSLGLAPVPEAAVEPFVLVACAVGATEEIVYRGWLLGRARVFGPAVAVAAAAAGHAAYKTALFVLPADPTPVDLGSLALLTFAGGLVLGGLRLASRSVLPPLLAHAAFDFVVYRAVARAPWWVWG